MKWTERLAATSWRLANDPRPNFSYAFQIGQRRYGWLYYHAPQDFCQTVSVACCLSDTKDRELSKVVHKTLYNLAIDEGFHRWQTDKGRKWEYQPTTRVLKSFVELAELGRKKKREGSP